MNKLNENIFLSKSREKGPIKMIISIPNYFQLLASFIREFSKVLGDCNPDPTSPTVILIV